MTVYIRRRDSDALIRELELSMPREAGERLKAHIPELVRICRRDGELAFRRRWRELVHEIMARLLAEALVRSRALPGLELLEGGDGSDPA